MKRSAIVRAAATAAAATFAMTGCGPEIHPRAECDFYAVKAARDAAPPPGPVLVPPIPGSLIPMPLNAVNVADGAITNKVLVQATNARRFEGGDIEVFARTVNCTDYPLQIEARTHFLDGAQGDAEPVSAWSRIHLLARALTSYTERSVAGAVVASYLIEVREGR